ncbi:hypothetical protein GCM10023091_29380 [Ravibacter arvi]|uniref:DUF4142 domain-containing protein n=1 Tax=Ravibacter arvi TaxID=2051041 RepID=A0ABP8M1D7_9BACT
MKTLITSVLLALSALHFLGCGPKTDSQTQVDGTNDVVTEIPDDTVMNDATAEKDAEFAMKAANGGMAEVQLGEIAQTKGVDPKIKEFGKMMVDDHTKANDELKALASAKGIALPAGPDEETAKAITDVSSKNGRDFDKAYAQQMEKDHEKTVKLFEDGQEDVQDTEIRAFIDKTLPVLRSHLEQSRNLNKRK